MKSKKLSRWDFRVELPFVPKSIGMLKALLLNMKDFGEFLSLAYEFYPDKKQEGHLYPYMSKKTKIKIEKELCEEILDRIKELSSSIREGDFAVNFPILPKTIKELKDILSVELEAGTESDDAYNYIFKVINSQKNKYKLQFGRKTVRNEREIIYSIHSKGRGKSIFYSYYLDPFRDISWIPVSKKGRIWDDENYEMDLRMIKRNFREWIKNKNIKRLIWFKSPISTRFSNEHIFENMIYEHIGYNVFD